MTPLEEEIVRLTKIWLEFVNMDHHKDRDCHFQIIQNYSYGNEPYYQVEHYGYIASDFRGSQCDTIEEAQDELKTFLLREIHFAKQWINRNIKEMEDNPNEEFFLWDLDQYKKMIEILEKA